MIGLDDGGRLNDWDLCRDINVDKSLEGPRTVSGTFVYNSADIDIGIQGTWQFMSTRLLTNPGSRHTITDDLESHYFVLMWTALHWVKHNQSGYPGIDMEHIFDHQRSLPGGIVEGGLGKEAMYRSKNSDLHGVEFACKPFNKLFWDLWMAFAVYLTQRRDPRNTGPGEHSLQDLNFERALNSDAGPEPSVSPQEVIGLFEEALKQPGWIDDKVADQFPRVGSKNASGIPSSDLDNSGAGRYNPNQGKKRVFSKSLGIDLEQLSAKRPKGG
jgi:hypothetical protein